MFNSHFQKSPAIRSATLIASFAVAFGWLGCAGAGSSSQRGPAASAATSQQQGPESSPTGLDTLGALEQVSVPKVTEPPAKTEADTETKPPGPILIQKDKPPRPYALNGDKLILPTGLTIHRVPKRTVVRIVTERRTGRSIWEIVDKRKRRLALLRAQSWREVVQEEGRSITKNARSIRLRARREDWGPKPVQIIVDRFTSETHVYTLERRATGTDWIWSGLEIEPAESVSR